MCGCVEMTVFYKLDQINRQNKDVEMNLIFEMKNRRGDKNVSLCRLFTTLFHSAELLFLHSYKVNSFINVTFPL